MIVLGYRRVCSAIQATEVCVSVGYESRVGTRWSNVRELVLVKKDIIVGRLARPKNPRVAIEVIIPLYGADDVCVDYRARGAVPTAVGITIGGGEEYHLVVFSHDYKGNCWFEAEVGACPCGEL
jgi:hypothetical protein